MTSRLEDLLENIESKKDQYIDLGKRILEADDSKLFKLDFLAVAAINRSLSNCTAFSQLVRANNYLVPASLVRLQLDTFLRFYASWLVNDPHEFAGSVLRGTEIRRLKDQNDKKMTDRHLVDTAASKFPWMPKVYRQASGFIHLSDKHIYSSIESVHEDRTLSMYISSDLSWIPEARWVEIAEAFLAATDALFQYLEAWLLTKGNPELLQSRRKNT